MKSSSGCNLDKECKSSSSSRDALCVSRRCRLVLVAVSLRYHRYSTAKELRRIEVEHVVVYEAGSRQGAQGLLVGQIGIFFQRYCLRMSWMLSRCVSLMNKRFLINLNQAPMLPNQLPGRYSSKLNAKHSFNQAVMYHPAT